MAACPDITLCMVVGPKRALSAITEVCKKAPVADCAIPLRITKAKNNPGDTRIKVLSVRRRLRKASTSVEWSARLDESACKHVQEPRSSGIAKVLRGKRTCLFVYTAYARTMKPVAVNDVDRYELKVLCNGEPETRDKK
jgi:hypothetical protein